MSHQIMEMLTPEAQVAIKLHKKKYQWIDPLANEMIDGGRSLLNEVLRLIRPDVQTNVYAELGKIKMIKPVDYACNIIKWHSAMESKRISITNKVPGAYHESQYIMDYLDTSLTVEVKISKLRLTSFATVTFVEIQIVGLHHTFLVRLLRPTTTCLKMALGSVRLAKKIKSLHSP
jgi:hypothetical protein